MNRAAPLTARRLATVVGSWDAGAGPTYRRLAAAIRTAVMDGRITTGTRLPSERSLAEATGLSRTTTTRAYEVLREDGLVRTRQGSGTVVELPFGVSGSMSMLARPDRPDGIAMTAAASEAPDGFSALVERAMSALPSVLATDGYLPDGLPVLRERIAARYSRHGMPTDPDQIIVTTGAQSALSLLVSALVRPGDRVLVEGCGYPHAFDMLQRAGARLLPLPIADSPWPVDEVARLAPAARLALLVPDFHNPTGASMSSEARAEIARSLAHGSVTTIIDETLRDVNVSGLPQPEHYGVHAPDAIVVGSVAKSLWGGLRIGWIRAPRTLVPRLVQARMVRDLGTAALDQLIVATALEDGEIDLRTRTADLRERRDVLLDAVGRRLPDWQVSRPDGGLSAWATLPAPLSSALTSVALDEGLTLTPGPRFFPTVPILGEHHLRLPFALRPEILEEAVVRLARAWALVTTGQTGGTADPDAVDLIA
ncbi:PLP-dependent aminotransferase family protein [Aeromicrobium senzhongii]|uniref:PLP-dependent aminotransferase family protein n=1 Tax=Aeromicrobium senzhongii TaxID=2663859 RepID=A0ABX6SQ08_9ACTN|nr:PLP-dependent aminotransferase family protein [Aeromicrobium senzhongii]QNL93438.1 PLP-dependent aminotransferase family protein [Aeromicrobium senzhongii]